MHTDMHGSITILSEDAAAVHQFREVWNDVQLMGDLGPTLTCKEVDALAGLLRALDLHYEAEVLIEEHAREDQSGDQHYTLGLKDENGYWPCVRCGAYGSSEDHELDNEDGACSSCQDACGNTLPPHDD